MTSGIYKLEWPSGAFYIGKSDNIERRWKQHANSFNTGKHAKNMQATYQREGEPDYSIVYEVHADHIDIVEGLLIEQYIGQDNCLNTTSGRKVDEIDRYTLGSNLESLKSSTAQHLRFMERVAIDINNAENKVKLHKEALERLEKEGVRIPEEQLELEEQLKDSAEYWEEQFIKANDTLERTMRRGLFARIFNIKV